MNEATEIESSGSIEPIEIQEEMEQSFLDYAMSVIVSRALPDSRDGLKPVHRRILWGMYDLGARPDRPTMKSARVTGEVMGKYHPHGDSAIYEALVRLAQNFSLRHPVIHPKGNFGYSPDDSAAAPRYTECRLDPIAMKLLDGIEEDTVDFIDNYSGEFSEPEVLPARFPNLLVNGIQGIAVGMATNIPTHNLVEVIDATIHLIDNPEATPDDLMEFIPGPDFPTGALILGRAGIKDAYRTGRGSIRMRARTDIEEDKSTRIVVTELPYQVSPNQVMTKIRDLVDSKELEGIADINDESAQGKTRIVIKLKRDAPALVILNNLYKRTPLQTTFSVNAVALVDGVPRQLNLKGMIDSYIDHQLEVVRRRSQHRLDKAHAEAHINEGLIKALDHIDEIISLIKASEDRATAREALMAKKYSFSEIQANHILDMQLVRLTRLGRTTLENRLDELKKIIQELEEILGNDQRLREVIKEELKTIQKDHGTERKSEMIHDPGELDVEDLIDDEDQIFTMSDGGYVKLMSADEFRTQGRGGRGVAGARLKDEDVVTHLLHTSAHAYLLFFSTKGKVYRLKAHQVPTASRTARGTAIVNLLPLQPDESIQAVIDTRDYETQRYLFFATRSGRVKKTQFTAYDSSLKAGLIAIKLNDDDELVDVMATNGEDDLLLVARSGQTLRISEKDVRPMGRSAAGVKGMRFRENDELLSCAVVKPEANVLHLTTEGFGKRTPLSEFSTKGRGGLGVRGIQTTDDRGEVAGATVVNEGDHIFAITSGGVIIRMNVDDISIQGRSATGVRVMTPDEDQHVVALSRVPVSEFDDEE
ncbi:MAG: DNA gyrase subunit A [Acidimicrobiales bacterium]|tara:strand:+ start:34235 stop:36688 length:2454 start_codon:yes stop_codon:yes gene_type:complete